jgi:CRP-like cAMP-binding protein
MNQELVGRIPLFEGVGRRRRHVVAALADEVAVPAGTRLTRQGALAAEFFVVVEGQAQASIDGERVGRLGPGGFFGEIGLLSEPVRTATVVASTPMRLLVVAPREFAALLDEFPAVAERIRIAAASRSATLATA